MNSYAQFEDFLNGLKNRPRLLVHSCCGPCSSSVLELLNKYFDVDVFYYNPNIYPKEEYIKRKKEQEKILDLAFHNKLIVGDYDFLNFEKVVSGFEDSKEGGMRCYKCIYMRMEKTCLYAKENNYDYFTTTLSVSPHKNSKMINEIGNELASKYSVRFLFSDFKKRDGYKKSIELSKKYNLYRQDYCGCKYSKKNDKKFNINID